MYYSRLLNKIQSNAPVFIKELNFLLKKGMNSGPEICDFNPIQKVSKGQKSVKSKPKYMKLETNFDDQKTKYDYFAKLLEKWHKSKTLDFVEPKKQMPMYNKVITIGSSGKGSFC